MAGRIETGDEAHQAVLALALEPGDADDLAGAQLERHGRSGACAGEVLGLEQHRAERLGARLEELLDRPSDHALDELVDAASARSERTARSGRPS